MAKEKSEGDKFSAIGKQTMARTYSAMDYYFDHLKETIASAPSAAELALLSVVDAEVATLCC